MINIIKSDIFRIYKGKQCVFSMLGLTVLGIFLMVISGESSGFEAVKGGLTNGGMFIPLFLTNILVVVWGHEFNYRVVNNTLIAGVSREHYFISKVILTYVLTILFVSIYSVSLIVTAAILKGSIPMVIILKIIGIQLPFYLMAVSIGIFLFNSIQAIYVSVSLFIILAFIGDSLVSMIISTYLPKLDMILDTMIFTNISSVVDIQSLSTNLVGTMLISGCLYLVIAVSSSFILFNKRELK